MSPLSSVFENIMYSRLIVGIKDKISNKQHGFIPGKSVATNLMQLSNQVTNALQTGTQVDTIYLDLAKAFDSVDHQILLGKLAKFGLDKELLNWFQSYLKDRIHMVFVNGNKSEPYTASSGVPQGSRLGPMLFNIFIDDIVNVVENANIELFADDCRLSMTVTKAQDTTKLQHDINSITRWIDKNKMKINNQKCQKITFGRVLIAIITHIQLIIQL